MNFKIVLPLFFILVAAACQPQQNAKFPFQNSALPLERRVEDLLGRMTLEEKVSQMKYDAPAIERLGVPAYNWWNECLHGLGRAGVATVFPQAIGMAASWNAPMMHNIATVISDEARAKHHKFAAQNKRGIYMGLTFWTPNINIFRDPRWGRGQETYGEDPYLTARFAVNFIKGLQGDHEKYLKTVATSKHYAVHSGPEPLRHEFNAEVSDKDLYETYLPHFRATVEEANVESVMCAYNAFRGQPCCGSDQLLTEILKEQFGFKGYIVSDCWGIEDLYNPEAHGVVETGEAAAAMAVKSGTDLNCGDTYDSYLLQAVQQGLISEQELDASLKKLFAARFKLGMFDDPDDVPYADIPYDVVASDDHQDLALQASRESLVLLKNENNLLPLSKDIRSIAVIGPNADDYEVMLGNYHGTPSRLTTVFEGIRQKLSDGVAVHYAEGCDLVEGFPNLKPIPPSALSPAADAVERGLKAEYYDNIRFDGQPVFSKVDTMVNMFWQGRSPITGVEADTFAVRWTGNVVAPKTGTYKIGFSGAHGVRFTFAGEEKFDSYFSHHPQTHTFEVELQKGQSYPLQIDFYSDGTDPQARLLWAAPDRDLQSEALEAARKAEAVVLVMGLHPRLEGEEMGVALKGFQGGDRTEIKLPAVQTELIQKIHALGKPTVLVLLAGSAVAFPWENENIPAIMYGWYPGERGGDAIADALFGDYNPSGRLPVTIYRSVEDLPEFTDYSMENRTYKYFKGDALYPFGHGLSYTRFEYENLQMPETINTTDSISISVRVLNAGNAEGQEVVQLYVSDAEASFRAPVRSLAGFKKVSLEPGESQTVTFTLSPEKYGVVNDDGKLTVEPGRFLVSVGGKQPGFTGLADARTTGVLTGSFTAEGDVKIFE